MSSHVVYHFKCANCGVCYIGETTIQYIRRVDQHLHTDKKSAVYKHLRENDSCMTSSDRNSFSIIDKARTEFQLRIKEAFYIQKMQPILNTQVKSVKVELVF